MLADQNEPSIKAVLKLKLPNEVAGTPLKAPVEQVFASDAVALGNHCEGEFLISMDVRGTTVHPRGANNLLTWSIVDSKVLLCFHS